jgi:hypothetical protein
MAGCRDAIGPIELWFDLAVEVLRIRPIAAQWRLPAGAATSRPFAAYSSSLIVTLSADSRLVSPWRTLSSALS